MYFLLKPLINELNKYNRIYIWGLGDYSKIVYPVLCKLNFRGRIQSFILSQKGENDYFDGIPIITLEELGCNEKDACILVAVSRRFEDEIVIKLRREGCFKIILLSDYERSDDEPKDRFTENSLDQLCDNIAEWLAWKNCEIDTNYIGIRENIKALMSTNRQKDENKMVFILRGIWPRQIKIIQALKQKNYEITVLFWDELYKSTQARLYIDSLDKIGVEIYSCECVEEMLYYSLQLNPFVYYFVAKWGGCQWAEVMLSYKQYIGKIVIEAQDIVNAGMFGLDEKCYESEKAILENADGVVWRWFAKEYLEERKGFVFKGKSIQFCDGCECQGELQFEKNKEADMVKICFVSAFPEKFFNDGQSVEYEVPASFIDILKKIGNRNDCIFHVYIGVFDEQVQNAGRALEQKYDNFKVYWGTQYNELLERLKDYDYGCYLFTGGVAAPYEYIIDGRFTGAAHRLGVANRFYDYLDAGLAIIASQPEMQCNELSKYGVVIKMDLDDLDIDYLIINKARYKQSAIEARKKLSTFNCINDMELFLKSI